MIIIPQTPHQRNHIKQRIGISQKVFAYILSNCYLTPRLTFYLSNFLNFFQKALPLPHKNMKRMQNERQTTIQTEIQPKPKTTNASTATPSSRANFAPNVDKVLRLVASR